MSVSIDIGVITSWAFYEQNHRKKIPNLNGWSERKLILNYNIYAILLNTKLFNNKKIIVANHWW